MAKVFLINIDEQVKIWQKGTYRVTVSDEETKEDAFEKLLKSEGGYGTYSKSPDIEHEGDAEVDYNTEEFLKFDTSIDNVNSIEETDTISPDEDKF